MSRGHALRSHARVALVAAALVVTTAHVGNPNVYYAGKAGPYDVNVVIRPPAVIPGRAEITVRLATPDAATVRRVVVRPVYWRTGTRGSPKGEEAARIAAPEPTFTGRLWLMWGGSYSVLVTVEGTRGAGTATVPVSAVATARLPLPATLKVLLVILGFVLFFGMLTIVHAAAGESRVAPDSFLTVRIRRRARNATVIAAPILLLVVFGGWRWWQAEARDFERRLYRPLDVRVTAVGDTLRLTVTDSVWTERRRGRVVPDHGKLMHMFLVREPGRDVFAHLHPAMRDSVSFVTPLPPLPPGRYRVFGDVVHESGLEMTLVGIVDLAATPRSYVVDPDDAWNAGGSAAALVPRAAASLGDGLTLYWLGAQSPFVAGQPADLRFAVRDATGRPVSLEPYMDMDGHAVVLRDDAAVFVHLHPMGTVTTAAQQLFALRDRGDTTADGTPRIADAAPMHAMGGASEVSFPYEFPRPGRYHLWVQVKQGGRVRTAPWTVTVADSAATP